jgi:hypothetical protein
MSNMFVTQLTLDDYLAANRLNYREVMRSRRPLYFIGIIWVVYTGLILIIQKSLLELVNIFQAVAVASGLALAVVLLTYGIGYVVLPYRTRKMLAQNKLAGLETHVEIMENAIKLTSEASTTNLAYDLLFKWVSNDKVIALYPANNIFFILPRRSMSVAQYKDIIAGLTLFDQNRAAAKELKS